MQYFLAKTEPSTYSIADLERDKETIWDGVHNYQAIAIIKTMKPGDCVFIYHSIKEKRIVGEAEIVGEPYENKEDPRFSWAVKIRHITTFSGPTLAECKASPVCQGFLLTTHSRLSTMPMPERVVQWVETYK